MENTDLDKVLIKKMSEGDQSAFRTLFMKYFARLCLFVQTLIRKEDEAKEIVQKVFVRLWEKRNLIVITRSVYAYLMTACRNETISQIRSTQTRSKYESEYADNFHVEESYEPELCQADISGIIDQAIATLPDKCRQIYTLSKKNGLSYQEIAEYLDVSVKTVENQIGIALKKLREALEPHKNLIRG